MVTRLSAVLCAFGLSSSVALARHHHHSRSSGDGSDYGSDQPTDLGELPTYGNDSPVCIGNEDEVLAVNNADVLVWEDSTGNGFLTRAHILGTVTNVYPDRTGHKHFGVQIGDSAEQSIEVIYSQDFGSMPDPSVGSVVEACGDYITSTAPNGRYPASPDRAILHWVHRSNSSRHASGFVIMDGVIYQ